MSEKKVGSNTAWKILERICTYTVTFTLSILIARILDPSEYGLVAMVTVFITVADVFVTNGLGNALIRTKNVDNDTFSSTLYVNMALSLVLYLFLYFIAPVVASFYNEPKLTLIMRILSIRVIVGSAKSIFDAYLIKDMAFKKIFIVSFIGSVVSAIVGLILAYNGYGVWTLVTQSILSVTITVFLEIIISAWKPKAVFKLGGLRPLFSFGWKLLLGGLIETIGNEIGQLVIGKKYSSKDLAFYNRGQSVPKLISSNVTNSIATVMYPVLTDVQDDRSSLLKLVRESERMTAYIVFPLFFGLYAVSPSFIYVLLGEKWVSAVVYMKLYCIVQLIVTPNYVVQNAVCAIGRSDLKLIMDIIRKVLYISLLLAVMGRGVIAIAVADVIIAMTCIILVLYIAHKHIKYKIKDMIYDHMQTFILCVVMLLGISTFELFIESKPILLFLQIITGIVVYLAGSIILKNKEFALLSGKIKRVVLKIKNNGGTK